LLARIKSRYQGIKCIWGLSSRLVAKLIASKSSAKFPLAYVVVAEKNNTPI